MAVRKSASRRRDEQVESAQKRLEGAKKRLAKAESRVNKVRASAQPAEDAYALASSEVASADAYLTWVQSMPNDDGTLPAAPAADPAFADSETAVATDVVEDDDVDDEYEDDDEYDDEDEIPASA